MAWICKNCNGELVDASFYDEQGVEGIKCSECGNTIPGSEFDGNEIAEV